MQLMRFPVCAFALLLMLSSLPVCAQSESEDEFDVDFLLSYYDQDGDHSAVTGGIGSESLQVVSPVVLVNWRVNDKWTLSTDIGIDQISSASIGNIQLEVSSASIPASDTRMFGSLKAQRTFANQTLGLTLGAANEYDYESISYGIDWSVELNQENTAISAALRHFDDQIELIGIDGFGSQGDGFPETEGWGDRTTTDFAITLSQAFGKRTIGSLELFASQQEGVLSTPYHEVIFIPDSSLYPEGQHVAERLPDSRDRKAIGLRLNHSFSDRIVQRVSYRYYDDDWGISAHTIELETHFRLNDARQMWVYPILRFSTQDAADYFGAARTFSGAEDYYTSDWDLAETTSTKFGIGWSVNALPGREWFMRLDRFDARATFYDRDDGLSGITTSFGFGWTF